MPDFQSATVTSHTNPASTFHIINFETGQPLSYQPGQYLMVKVADRKINHYSISTALSNRKLQFIVDTKPGREGSRLIQSLQAGDTVQFLGPLGIFKLHLDDGSRELVFLATGSGISAIKAMIEHSLANAKDNRPIKLYFGLRHYSDIFLHDYFQNLDQQYQNFTFIPSLSQPDDRWTGSHGHVTSLARQDYRDGSSLSAYLCGNGQMIEEAKNFFASIGTPGERIYHEKFY